ncbi:hypothetical protein A3K86_03345 [Photobacterium jeanii]|uniref:DUF3108 domain-containing protein n=1 Tax=Photobacterium jeanii TaxID=858640 RepID=A0A178KL28_9GAMM|nr:hypothetical protein [Photobacterium jeanii]OAN17967.1 hypothetical protein A3K86_03345 [Photobacterium jeanii]PST92363.1 hypothetical protein C9I91_04100 [Photobacterium jeanii]
MKIKLLPLAIMIGITAGCGGSGGSDEAPEPKVTASSCFNAELYTVGRKVEVQTKENGQLEETMVLSNLGHEMYRGENVLHQQAKSKSGKTFSLYLMIDEGSKTQTTVGLAADGVDAYYKPGKLDKFALSQGESYEQVLTMVSSMGEVVTNNKTTFKGIETVKVPAGEFRACKFEEQMSITQIDGSQTQSINNKWYAVDKGYLVKQSEKNSLSELVSYKEL